AGEELEGGGEEDGEEAGPGEGQLGQGPDAVELARAVVVAPEGLGALGYADDGEDEEHGDGVDDADDGEGGLSAQAGHGVVGYDEHDEGEALDYGYGDAELEHRGDGRGLGGESAGFDLEDAPMVLDEPEGEGCAEGLGDDGGPGGAGYAPAEGEDEEGGEDSVQDGPADGGDHGGLGSVLGAEAVCDSHRGDLEDEAYHDYAQVFAGHWHDPGGGAEGDEDRVHKEPAEGCDEGARGEGGGEALA